MDGWMDGWMDISIVPCLMAWDNNCSLNHSGDIALTRCYDLEGPVHDHEDEGQGHDNKQGSYRYHDAYLV